MYNIINILCRLRSNIYIVLPVRDIPTILRMTRANDIIIIIAQN
jgi:hypothetical protein